MTTKTLTVLTTGLALILVSSPAFAADKKKSAAAAPDRETVAKPISERERKRREEEANRPIAYREGVVLCKQVSKKNWRCEGPLQMTYSDGELDAPIGIGALKMACGTSKRCEGASPLRRSVT